MSESNVSELVDKLKELEIREIKILIFSSYETHEGESIVNTRLKNIQTYLDEKLVFPTDIFLASDKELKMEGIKEHVLELAEDSDIVLIIIFKDAVGPTVGAELDKILEDSSLIRKTILCVPRGYNVGGWFATQPQYSKIAKVVFRNEKQLQKKAFGRILDKRRELRGDIIRDFQD